MNGWHNEWLFFLNHDFLLDGYKQYTTKIKDVVTAKWTNEDLDTYIDLMVKQVNSSGKPIGTFSKKAWQYIQRNFR